MKSGNLWKWPALALGALALGAAALLAPAAATALENAVFSGPPITTQPGPYYNQGDFLGLCVANPGSGAQTYVEVNTDFGTFTDRNSRALGNCAPNHVQAVLPIDPSLYPIPAPSSTSSPTPTPTVTSSH